MIKPAFTGANYSIPVFLLLSIGLLLTGCTKQAQQATVLAQPIPYSPPAIDTTTWKIYTDPAYGFSFQYPPDWVAEPAAQKSSATGAYTLTLQRNNPKEKPVTIAIWRNFDEKKEEARLDKLGHDIERAGSIDINDKRAYVITYEDKDRDGDEVIISRGNMTYVFDNLGIDTIPNKIYTYFQ